MGKLKPVLGVALVALSLAACGSSETGSSSSSAAPVATTTAASKMGAAAAAGDGVTTAADVFGPSCKDLPQGDASGGLTSMGVQPVATAAGTNPLLTKLVAAVQAIPGLADTLNTTDNLTVFAPADPAFAALGEAKFQELAQNPTALAPILQFHVVAKRYNKDGLLAAKTVKSLNAAGGDITIAGSGDDVTINGAKVLCGNIPTKNATVFVIDSVLMPKA
ncbi:putative surface protein with fasciclin (FAS1) repeats [Actinokineospora baliensis]|uniref:fasciclin domain-containing protein n=1 Tax=Actinokineospora baliensis TaxID=547056 RepID=UPI00195EA86E|nr:fasciclin domain-containing protein [Actinokineospora baliensis]MBM7770484.1 putative surface protein with fasciclin (FAS1) repeats [Actinokineospora baliensis]